MSVTDLIADQLTVMRNSIMVGKKDVTIKRSGILEGICGILKKEGFIRDYQVIEDNKQGKIKVYLKMTEEGGPVMEHLKRVSTPGRRQYLPVENIKPVMGGVGIAILSTSKGLLTGEEASKEGVGGEVICRIW
jgi:small subunit ribosomal protein S8